MLHNAEMSLHKADLGITAIEVEPARASEVIVLINGIAAGRRNTG